MIMQSKKDTLTIFKNVVAQKGKFHKEIKKALAEGWHLYKIGNHEENMLCMIVYKKVVLPNAA